MGRAAILEALWHAVLNACAELCLSPTQADSLVYQAEKQVKELAEKAPEDNKAKVADKIKVREP